jgi:hypothetical protein
MSDGGTQPPDFGRIPAHSETAHLLRLSFRRRGHLDISPGDRRLSGCVTPVDAELAGCAR